MTILRSLYHHLRSRRLALWLIVCLTGYTAFVSLWPRATLHSAFSNPLFVSAMLLLLACTLACTIERFAESVSLWRSRATITPKLAERILAHPDFLLESRPGRPTPRAERR